MSSSPDNSALYFQVANKIEKLIRAGTMRPGERVPSLRRACRQHGVSRTTAVEAYRLLEDRGLIEARPRSGFFVRVPIAGVEVPREPKVSRPGSAAKWVGVGGLQSRILLPLECPMWCRLAPLIPELTICRWQS